MKSKDKILIKVCGMKEEANMEEIMRLNPDFLGFIFYEPSPRNAIGIKKETIKNIPNTINPVGVFVDAPLHKILEITEFYGIRWVQLHGRESPDFCIQLKEKGYKIIKALRMPCDDFNFNFNKLNSYAGYIDHFLFDTSGKAAGGNGIKFNWEALKGYNQGIPYLLSGGISPIDATDLAFNLPKGCIGVDLNSKFEDSPGVKNYSLLSQFIKQIRNE